MKDRPLAELKQRLLDELLSCIVQGEPLPNPQVYSKPWMRDAAVMALVLDRIGEASLIRPWILGLSDPFDRNNGSEEPDNLGQAFYLASLAGDDSLPLAVKARERLPEFLDDDGLMLGTTDFSRRASYSGRWLNFGLAKLGLPPQASLPPEGDDYEVLFWMDGPKAPWPGTDNWASAADYPYLGWAAAHSLRLPPPLHLLGRVSGFLTWESQASAADYDRIPAGSPASEVPRTCAPHSWHAAEAWLYLDDLEAAGEVRS